MRKFVVAGVVAIIATFAASMPIGAVSAQQVMSANGACANYNQNLSGSRIGVAKVTIASSGVSPGWQSVSTSVTLNGLSPNSTFVLGLALNQDADVRTGCFVPSWLIFTTDRKGDAMVNQTVSVYSGYWGYQIVLSRSVGFSYVAGFTTPSFFTVP